MIQNIVRILIGVLLLLLLTVQFTLGMLFTSDIPIHVKNEEYDIFLVSSVIVVIVSIMYIIFNRIKKNFLVASSVISFFFSVLWFFSLNSIIQLESYPSIALYMNLIGTVISFTLFIISILYYYLNLRK